MSRKAASASDSAGADERPIPTHVAIIMDGNGRWANARHLPRAAGHERGVEALRGAVEAAGELGITHLTVYSFSTENWRRPAAEVNALFGLLKTYIRKDLNRLRDEGVRIRIIGRREGLPDDISELVERAERETKHNVSFFLNIAFNYGGREEIVRAVKALAGDLRGGDIVLDDISEDLFETYLDTQGTPDPDIIIRTSGEYRLSNFLLWQSAYSELIFLDVLWPDFDRGCLEQAIRIFHERERRFGAVTPGGA